MALVRRAASESRSNRPYLMVDEGLWSFFHREWRRIDREWRSALTVGDVQDNPDMLHAVAAGVAAARRELREVVAAFAHEFPGNYILPI